jgi:4-hydroxybenzoate polyprenyltransferase
LVLQLNAFSIFLSFIALFLAIFYPLTKRFFAIPQLFLGLAFSMAILMAFTATKNSIPSEAWLLFLANVFWALSYDTHYAVTDLKDDMNLPIHSSAKFFGRWTPHFITFNYLLMFIILFYLGFRLENSILYFLPLIIALYFALNGIYFSKKMSPEMNFMAFKKANLIGFVIFLAFLLEYL